jgi:hypothetical protein
MGVTVDASELKAFQQNIENQIHMLNDFVERVGNALADDILKQLKARTPVDTGRMRDSWKIGTVHVGSNGVIAELMNGADYSSFVEYGHKTRGGGWVPGKQIMTATAQEMSGYIHEYLQAALDAHLREVFGGG